MFEGGAAKSFSIFPIRVVYMPDNEQAQAPVSILVSVSKRRFKRAVKRNRVKRQIREAYRNNKHLLTDKLQQQGQHLLIAFIYLADELTDSAQLEEKMQTALIRIAEKFPLRSPDTPRHPQHGNTEQDSPENQRDIPCSVY